MNLFVRVRKDVKLFVEDLNVNAEQTILFIHGWPLNHNMWEYEVEYLIEIGYRVVTIDLRGYGQSDRPTDGYDYDTMASDIKGIIDALQLKNITLVGHSMGAAIAIRYISKYKANSVSRLVLLSAAAPSAVQTKEFEFGLVEDTLDDYIEQIYNDRPQFITTIKNLFFFRYTTPEFDKWFEDLCLKASGWATAKSLIALRDERLFDDLKAINIPTLILHGVHDKVCPFDLATYLNKNIKDSYLIPLKESGHAAFFEQKDEVSDAIDKFIRKELAKNK